MEAASSARPCFSKEIHKENEKKQVWNTLAFSRLKVKKLKSGNSEEINNEKRRRKTKGIAKTSKYTVKVFGLN
ncbi:MAG TPA: hypothetical protein VF596_08785 [Pyrinomonadaceae bacterium]|jgi:hypothetical protein